MLVVFSPIFVAETKIIFVYNFVAPLHHSESLTDQVLKYEIIKSGKYFQN